MTVQTAALAIDYDTVELRTGRLRKIYVSEARTLGGEDRTVAVVKCYCRSHDVLTAAEAELQKHPTFVFPIEFFKDLESLIGRDLEGRIYSNTLDRRVKFSLDVKEHVGFQLAEGEHTLHSPWYDERVLNE
jgi:hypothetical protein